MRVLALSAAAVVLSAFPASAHQLDAAPPVSLMGLELQPRLAFWAQGPSPYMALGGRHGLSMWHDVLEVGFEGKGLWFPTYPANAGLSFGPYLQLAPIPGFGLYLHARAQRAVGTGSPVFNALELSCGLGYRQPLNPGFAIFEIGLERAYLYNYGENLFAVEALKAGYAW